MPIAALIVVVLFAAGIVYLQQRLIDKLQAEKSELMDRWYVSKGQPPSGVNMVAVHEKRTEEKDAAKKIALPRADQLTHARHKLIKEELIG